MDLLSRIMARASTILCFPRPTFIQLISIPVQGQRELTDGTFRFKLERHPKERKTYWPRLLCSFLKLSWLLLLQLLKRDPFHYPFNSERTFTKFEPAGLSQSIKTVQLMSLFEHCMVVSSNRTNTTRSAARTWPSPDQRTLQWENWSNDTIDSILSCLVFYNFVRVYVESGFGESFDRRHPTALL